MPAISAAQRGSGVGSGGRYKWTAPGRSDGRAVPAVSHDVAASARAVPALAATVDASEPTAQAALSVSVVARHPRAGRPASLPRD
eukprot:scaffold12988_cov112-Isochrysis_galbana.AAC.6